MPFFGKKADKKEKTSDAPDYPRQTTGGHPPTNQAMPHINHPYASDYQQPIVPQQYIHQGQNGSTSVHVAIPRSDLPGAGSNWCEGLLDGPDFSNRVPDPRIPPAPGSFYVYSHGAGPSMPQNTGYMGPPPPNQQGMPPPPTYDEVLSQEVKKKL